MLSWILQGSASFQPGRVGGRPPGAVSLAIFGTKSVFSPMARRLRKTEPVKKDPEEKEMTEAEIAMLEAKRRHEAEEEARGKDNDERRRQELAAVEQELQELKASGPHPHCWRFVWQK